MRSGRVLVGVLVGVVGGLGLAGAAWAGEAEEKKDLSELERKLEVLAAEIERLKLGEAAATASESQYGYGPAASKVYRTAQGLSIGGYGEMVYQGPESRRDDGAASGRTAELDFLRGVVYFGYKFNDRFLFNSEIEFEHATTGRNDGQASVEFAYLDYLIRPEVNVRAGLLLMPMGFVNELHEPTVFLGARRPDVERVLLPTTWRENGFGLFGEIGPVSYRTYVVNGLRADGFTAGGLRGGRQSGGRAQAEDFAWVGRVDYSPAPGFTLGGSLYLGDSGQVLTDAQGRLGVGTTVWEGHAEWKGRGLELRGLIARAELDDVARLNRVRNLTGAAGVGESLAGEYVEAAYDVLAPRGGRLALKPYVRWEQFDTQDEVATGFTKGPANDVESLTFGLAIQPIDQLILKLDYQDFDNGAGTAVDQFNVAIGYIF